MAPVPQPERCPDCGSTDVRRSGVRIQGTGAGAGSRMLRSVRPTTAWRWVCGACSRRLGTAPPPAP